MNMNPLRILSFITKRGPKVKDLTSDELYAYALWAQGSERFASATNEAEEAEGVAQMAVAQEAAPHIDLSKVRP